MTPEEALDWLAGRADLYSRSYETDEKRQETRKALTVLRRALAPKVMERGWWRRSARGWQLRLESHKPPSTVGWVPVLIIAAPEVEP